MQRQRGPQGKPGELRDKKLARKQAKWVLDGWSAYRGGHQLDDVSYLAAHSNVTDGTGKSIGKQTTIWTVAGQTASKSDAKAIEGVDELLKWQFASHLLVADEVILQGGDKANYERSFRVLAKTDDGNVVLWFSLFDRREEHLQFRLIKAARANDRGEEEDLAVIFDEYVDAGGVMFPRVVRVVRGLAEITQREMTMVSHKVGEAQGVAKVDKKDGQ
jgi:hypothetical protein